VKLIEYDRNRGKGYAVKVGFDQATGDLITILDADGELSAKQIPRYINMLQSADCVIASRSHPQSIVDIPLSRRVLGKFFNALVQLLTGLRCGDTQCGLKALKKQVIRRVRPASLVKGFAFDVELLSLANLYGFKIAEAPVEVHSRQALFSVRAVFRMFKELLGITYRLRIKKWYQKQLAK
jgi:glycosyltransferase involved in cell wall biosynthesis